MPALGAVLDKAAIERLVEYIWTRRCPVPAWDVEQIEASRKVPVATADLVEAPVHDADPMNMFIVVELGDHHMPSVLDGDRMNRFTASRRSTRCMADPNIHRTDASLYFLSRDGWVSKFDMGPADGGRGTRQGSMPQSRSVGRWTLPDGRRTICRTAWCCWITLRLRPLKLIDVQDDAGRARG